MTLGNLCLEPVLLDFECPFHNNESTAQPNVTGDLRVVKCRVCGLRLAARKDLDPRANQIMIEVRFGHNLISGVFEETGISRYAIFVTDSSGARLPDMPEVMNVTVRGDANTTTCCDDSAYAVRVEATLPLNVSVARLEVVPVPEFEMPLPAGLLTEPFADWADRAFVTSLSRRPTASVSLLAVLAAIFEFTLLHRTTPGRHLPMLNR